MDITRETIETSADILKDIYHLDANTVCRQIAIATRLKSSIIRKAIILSAHNYDYQIKNSRLLVLDVNINIDDAKIDIVDMWKDLTDENVIKWLGY